MGFWMASAPFKHPKTGVYYFRRKVPEKLVGRLGRSWIKRSLGTKDPREARELFAVEAVRVEYLFKNAESVVELSFQQVTALANEWYAARLREDEANPGDADGLDTLLSDLSLDPGYKEKVAAVGQQVAASLDAKGLVVSDESHAALIDAFYESYRRLVWYLGKRARGDYAEDPQVATAPKFERELNKPKVTFESLVEGWSAETKPRERTRAEFARAIDRLSAFVGSHDANKATPEKVADFKADLLAKGRSPKSVKNSLSAINAVFAWGVRNRKIANNPAQGIRIKIKRRAGDGRRPFSLEEAKLILKAAKAETGAKRWVPLILAYTGARIGEIAQLQRRDVRQEEGIWCLDLNAWRDGQLKNPGSSRLIPLHPAIIKEGFLKSIEKLKPDSQLFPEFLKRAKGTRGDNASQGFRRWVRQCVGITDRKIGPTHSWRHLFKDRCREADIRNEIQDEITGHRPATVARSYGSRQFPVKVLYNAIKKLPALSL
jgi:integrase